MRPRHRRLAAVDTTSQEIAEIQAQDQIIDAVMARGLQADAIRTHPLVAWVVTRDEVACPGEFVARLMTSGPTLRDTGRHSGGIAGAAPPWPDAN